MAQPVFHRRFLSTLLIQQIQDFKLKHRPEHTLSVLIADVDDCARFNAMHGRPAGDRMLQAVAGVLSQQVRGHDFVFRYSGEEFLMILCDMQEGCTLNAAERIRQQVQSLVIPLDGPAQASVTLSIGAADYDGHPDALHLIERARQALQSAQAEGGNRCVLAPL